MMDVRMAWNRLAASLPMPMRNLWSRFLIKRIAWGIAARYHADTAFVFDAAHRLRIVERYSADWRAAVRRAAGLPATPVGTLDDLQREIRYLMENHAELRPGFETLRGKRVLYCGQAYYNSWYLSRALRELGWKADLLNWDTNPSTQIYYHGQDFHIGPGGLSTTHECVEFYVASLYAYDLFHFSNNQGINFGADVDLFFREHFEWRAEIHLLKQLGKKVVYSNNGCLDGVSQTAFSQWDKEPVCNSCPWRDNPLVCSDERNLAWGAFRNSVADYQCLLGGNRVDFNDDPRVHEVPEFYCLDPSVWHPDLAIPPEHRLASTSEPPIRVYHAVGHRKERTSDQGINIKSSHIYLPLIERLQQEGVPLELLAPTGVPNLEVRFMQLQADIFLEMLTFGWFGANAREAMMLGKPVICYIRPQWLESLRKELPEYAAELPIVSATPDTVEEVLRDLIAHPEKRRAIGAQSRAFALKWHSTHAAKRRFDAIYSGLLQLEHASDRLTRRDR